VLQRCEKFVNSLLNFFCIILLPFATFIKNSCLFVEINVIGCKNCIVKDFWVTTDLWTAEDV